MKRGLARRGQEVVAWLGVDEKAIAKRHRYLTVVADLERSRVLYLADDRKQESLDGFWATLTPAQRDGITAVAMDMWEPYVQSTRVHLPAAQAKIVFDKFHVVKTSARRRRLRAAWRAPHSQAGGRHAAHWVQVPLAHAAGGHAICADLARSGWELHEIAGFAGHRNPATTLQYIHLSGRDLAAKLGQSMEHVHAWRRAALAELVKGEA